MGLKSSEETEEGNFGGLALLISPGGITSDRESFLRPNSRRFAGAKFGLSGRAMLPVRPSSGPRQSLSPTTGDMEGTLLFWRAGPGRQAWCEDDRTPTWSLERFLAGDPSVWWPLELSRPREKVVTGALPSDRPLDPPSEDFTSHATAGAHSSPRVSQTVKEMGF